MQSRYTAGQRRAFVREWKRSGLSAKAFAEGRPFHSVTLCNWARAEARGFTRGPRLVEVVATPTEGREPSSWAWELKGPGGELRGVGLDAEALRVLVQGVVGGGR